MPVKAGQPRDGEGTTHVNDAPPTPGSSAPSVHLTQFSVVLVVNQIDPSIFNPDFLRLNQIVNPNTQVSESPISTPQLSQISFDDGVTVRADSGTVTFEETGDPLQLQNVQPPAMAIRFVTLFPNTIYKAVGMNPIGIPILDGAVDERSGLRSALVDAGTWLPFGGQTPTLGLWAAYNLPDKTMFFEIRDNDAPDQSRVVAFRLNIHRELPDQLGRNDRLLSVLAQWEADLTDFESLVMQCISKRTMQ